MLYNYSVLLALLIILYYLGIRLGTEGVYIRNITLFGLESSQIIIGYSQVTIEGITYKSNHKARNDRKVSLYTLELLGLWLFAVYKLVNIPIKVHHLTLHISEKTLSIQQLLVTPSIISIALTDLRSEFFHFTTDSIVCKIVAGELQINAEAPTLDLHGSSVPVQIFSEDGDAATFESSLLADVSLYKQWLAKHQTFISISLTCPAITFIKNQRTLVLSAETLTSCIGEDFGFKCIGIHCDILGIPQNAFTKILVCKSISANGSLSGLDTTPSIFGELTINSCALEIDDNVFQNIFVGTERNLAENVRRSNPIDKALKAFSLLTERFSCVIILKIINCSTALSYTAEGTLSNPTNLGFSVPALTLTTSLPKFEEGRPLCTIAASVVASIHFNGVPIVDTCIEMDAKISKEHSIVISGLQSIDATLLPIVAQSRESFSLAVWMALLNSRDKLVEKITNRFCLEIEWVMSSVKLIIAGEVAPHPAVNIKINDFKISKKGADFKILIEGASITSNQSPRMDESEFVDLFSIQIIANSELPISCCMKNATISVSLLEVYIALHSVLFPLKLLKLFVSSEQKTIDLPSFSVSIEDIILKTLLPDNVMVIIRISDVYVDQLLKITSANIALVESSIVLKSIAKSNDDVRLDLGVEECVFFTANQIMLHLHQKIPLEIFYESNEIVCISTPTFKVADIFENLVRFQKACKSMATNILGYYSPETSENYLIDPELIPVFTIVIARFLVRIVQDEFRAKIARNLKVGFIENHERLLLQRAFEKACTARGVEFAALEAHLAKRKEIYENPNLENVILAYRLAQKYSSDSYIAKVGLENPKTDLFAAKFTNINIIISAPDFGRLAVQQVLQRLDPTTLSNVKYLSLIPRNIHMSMDSFRLTLNEFLDHLIHLPFENGSHLETSGIIILAEAVPDSDSLLNVSVPLGTLGSIQVARNINPMKIYGETLTTITCRTVLQLCMGASFDPVISDLAEVVDSFTASTADKSLPVGWWDKFRLILHGSNQLKITGGGKASLKIFGSTTPDFDARRHLGKCGVEVICGGETLMTFGGQNTLEVRVECSHWNLRIPEEFRADSNIVTLNNVIFKFGIEFKSFKSEANPEHTPWKSHDEVLLRNSSFSMQEHDSFLGFRSKAIHLKIDISTKERNNTFLQTSRAWDELKLLQIMYGSILAHTKRGDGPKTPKLSYSIRRVHITTDISPISISSFSGLEDASGGVGIRSSAKSFLFDGVMVQRDVKIQGNKWNWDSVFVSVAGIEVRAIRFSSVISHNSGIFMFPHDLNSPLDTKEITSTPFIWSPNIVYFYISDRNQIDFTRHQTEGSYLKIQIEILQTRLKSIEIEIAQTISIQKTTLESASNSTSDKKPLDLCDTVEALYEKKIFLDDHIKRLQSTENLPGAFAANLASEKFCFVENYTIHNVNILWNVGIRDIVFKMIELQTKDFYVKYCTSNAAARVVSTLVDPTRIISDENTPRPSVYSAPPDFKEQTQRMLDNLLNDLKNGVNIVVEDENGGDPLRKDSGDSGSPYHPSSDPASPDFVDRRHILEYGMCCKFVNPQICLEVQSFGKTNCLIIAAPKMEITSLMVLDSEAANRASLDEQHGADLLVKTRTIVKITKSQILAGLDNRKYTGPLWVPMESLLDHRFPPFGLRKNVNQMDFTLHRDKLNTLYMSNSNADRSSDRINAYTLTCPNLALKMKKSEYLLWSECFTILIVFRDPEHRIRADKRRKMMFTMDQSPNLSHIHEKFLVLQYQLRELVKALDYASPHHPEIQNIRRQWIYCRDEIYIYMEALKIHREQQRKTVIPSWELQINFSMFEWIMVQDTNEDFCQWSLSNTRFYWLNNEDLSSYSTIEIDSINLENLMKGGTHYQHALGAYTAPGRDAINGQKSVRLLWKEKSPVGNIPVIEHFEFNLVPIYIHLTHEFGKSLMTYLFSDFENHKNDPESESGSAGSISTTKKIISPSSSTGKKYGKPKPKSTILSGSLFSVVNFDSINSTSAHTQQESDLLQMQSRAEDARSFIYIKIPGIDILLSYRASTEKALIDMNITNAEFHLSTLEFRNKTWTMYDLVQEIRRSIIRAALGSVKDNLFVKRGNNNDDSVGRGIGGTAYQMADFVKRNVVGRASKVRESLNPSLGSVLSNDKDEEGVVNQDEMLDSRLKPGNLVVSDTRRKDIKNLREAAYGKMLLGPYYAHPM